MWNSISSSSCFVATARRVIVRTLTSNRSIHRRFFIYAHCTTRLLLPVAIRITNFTVAKTIALV
jgi:hypothetical protein